MQRNLSAVAAQLGITRQTLYNKMKNSDYDLLSHLILHDGSG